METQMQQPDPAQISVPSSHLAKGSDLPLYLQLYTLLLRRLEAGEWPVGTQFPTIDQLMLEYAVSRVTVREAISRLERDGIVSRGRGRGTHVLRNPADDSWLLFPNTWQELVTHIGAMSAHSQTLHSTFATLKHDEFPAGQVAPSYWKARRINYTAHGARYSVTDVSLAADIYNLDPTGFSTDPILPRLAQLPNLSISEAHQSLSVTTADNEFAHLLQIEIGAPIVKVRRHALDQSNRLIYLADVIYNARHLRIDTKLI